MNEFDVSSGCVRQLPEVAVVHGHDLVAILGKQHDDGVDHVGKSCGGQQLPGRSPELFVEGPNVDSCERLGQPSLSRPAPPHLSDDSGVSERNFAFDLGRLEAGPHRSLVAFQSGQRTAVEHESHADFAGRAGCCGREPRTTVAFCRSARCWATISCAVMSPNSRSKSATAPARSDSLRSRRILSARAALTQALRRHGPSYALVPRRRSSAGQYSSRSNRL